MAKEQRLILLVILLVLLFVYLSMKPSEFFIGAATVPESCGTAGIRPSDATFKFIKEINPDSKNDPSAKRGYTKSECNKLKDGVYNGESCYQLKDKTVKDGRPDLSSSNIVLEYSQICGGLNQSTAVTPAPSECMIDGVHAGKPSVAFTMTRGEKKMNVEDNAFRLYTENECKLLKGEYIKLMDLVNMWGSSAEEQAKAEHLNGKDMGFCFKKGDDRIEYSFMCTINAAATPGAQVADATKKALTGWLNS
jgi:hypothetical protein